jgi:putative tricarboxylic transport membrane protein
MKLNDAVWGALLILFSVAVLVHVQHFPAIPGQKVGPALFPGVLAVALGVCAVILVVKGLAARRHGHERARWAELDGWTKSRRHVIAFVAVIGVNVVYILVVDWIGFILTGVAAQRGRGGRARTRSAPARGRPRPGRRIT